MALRRAKGTRLPFVGRRPTTASPPSWNRARLDREIKSWAETGDAPDALISDLQDGAWWDVVADAVGAVDTDWLMDALEGLDVEGAFFTYNALIGSLPGRADGRLIRAARSLVASALGMRGSHASDTWVERWLIADSDDHRRAFEQLIDGLLARAVARGRTVTWPVVASIYQDEERGAFGRVSLTVIPGGPPGLWPDPCTMIFFQADAELLQSTHDAWMTHARTLGDTCVAFTIDLDRDVRQADGRSFGFSIWCGLHDLSRSVRVRRRRARAVPSGSISATGSLVGIDLGTKSATMADKGQTRLIVPKDSEVDHPHDDVKVVPVSTAGELWRATQVRPALWITPVAAVAAVSVLTVGPLPPESGAE